MTKKYQIYTYTRMHTHRYTYTHTYTHTSRLIQISLRKRRALLWCSVYELDPRG